MNATDETPWRPAHRVHSVYGSGDGCGAAIEDAELELGRWLDALKEPIHSVRYQTQTICEAAEGTAGWYTHVITITYAR